MSLKTGELDLDLQCQIGLQTLQNICFNFYIDLFGICFYTLTVH